MATKILCSVLLMIALAALTAEACQNLLRLSTFEITDRTTGKVVSSLPLKRNKYLSVRIRVYAAQTLNRDWFSARLSAKATVYVGGFSLNMDLPCKLPNGCEFGKMSCARTQEYLGITHLGCPFKGPAFYEATATIPVVKDLTGEIPSWARNMVSKVQVTGRLDVWDNYGAKIGCMSTTLWFYKDY